MSAPEACDELIDRSCAPHLLTEMRAPVVGSGLIAFVAEVAATTMRDAEQIVQFLAVPSQLQLAAFMARERHDDVNIDIQAPCHSLVC
jgi:hypothetical protein